MISKSTKKWNTLVNRMLKTGLGQEGHQIRMDEVENLEREMFRNQYPFRSVPSVKRGRKKA